MNAVAYLSQLIQLLPSGSAWVAETGSVLRGLLHAGAEMLADVHRRATDLLDEADPRTAFELLPEWEKEVGLPGKCSASADTIRERQAMVHAKWISRGGQSRPYFINLAKALGYVITITEFTPFTCEDTCEDAVTDEGWVFVWQTNAAATTIINSTCESSCEDPLRDWGNTILECVITEDKPAHTQVIFTYSGD